MSTYRIVRFFESEDLPRQVIAEGLSLYEAQAHCQDPQTSSSTCTDSAGIALTEQVGRWFDGYEEEWR